MSTKLKRFLRLFIFAHPQREILGARLRAGAAFECVGLNIASHVHVIACSVHVYSQQHLPHISAAGNTQMTLQGYEDQEYYPPSQVSCSYRQLRRRHNYSREDMDASRAPSESLVRKEETDMEETSLDRANLAKIDEEKTTRWADFRPVGKHFYTEEPEFARMTAEDVGEFASASGDAVVKYPEAKERPLPGAATNPVTSFEEAFAKYPEILGEVYKNWSQDTVSNSQPRPANPDEPSWPRLPEDEADDGKPQIMRGGAAVKQPTVLGKLMR
ncbi:hypothetical protein HPB49_022761 [Dermacentor silvarum]|uniref:Uncharacterized protein n=1 Tax=Dermacentor silvarum TaxID=543639 RepID=A0ACB8D829_DERSI|nr:hypothetical protein HPB49_022761 [Dermacentor silvarum]